MNRGFFLLSFIGLCALRMTVHAEAMVLTPSQDNTLYESLSGALSNGSGAYLFTGRTAQSSNSIRRAVLMFDVAGSIPPGSTIEAAELTLQMSRTPSAADRDVSLHRITAAWGEGASDASGEEGNGAPSAPSDATWIHTRYDANFWSAIGGDFTAAASATNAVGALAPYVWGSTPDMVADVQGWVDQPATNFGWLVLGDESVQGTAKRFNSRENADPQTRPVLTVTFTPPESIPTTSTWGLVGLTLSLVIAGTLATSARRNCV